MTIKYSDSGFLDGADETKKLSFDVSGVTTGTTRTITMPDANVDLSSVGTPDDNSVTLAKMAGGTDGNLITYDASGDPAYVTTGTSGQILTSGGTGVAPTFQAAAGGGKVLQLVWATPVSANQDISTTTWTDVTGMTLNITPAATTSKIFVYCNVIVYFQEAHSGLSMRIDRGGSVITSQVSGGYGVYDGDETRRGSSSIMFYDAPSSTSQLTYKIQAKSYSAKDTELHESSDGYMYAFEIGA